MISNKRADRSNLTAAMQKNGGKYAASVTDYDIPTIYGKTGQKMKNQPEMEILTIKGAFNYFVLSMQILNYLML